MFHYCVMLQLSPMQIFKLSTKTFQLTPYIDRHAESLQCLVKILYLMVVPFWCMVSLELSWKFWRQQHRIRNSFEFSAQVSFLTPCFLFECFHSCIKIKSKPSMNKRYFHLAYAVCYTSISRYHPTLRWKLAWCR